MQCSVLNVNRADRILHSYPTQLQPLDVRPAFHGILFLPVLPPFVSLLSFSETHFTQKSTVITWAGHGAAPTNSTLSEMDDFCLAVQQVSNALMELHTSLISTTRKKFKKKGKIMCFGGLYIRNSLCESYTMFSRCSCSCEDYWISFLRQNDTCSLQVQVKGQVFEGKP